MREKHVNEGVKIVIVPTQTRKAYGVADRRKIEQVVKGKLLLASTEPYHKVQVEVEHGSDGKPKALVASMLRAHTYTADIVRVNVDADYSPKSIEHLS